MSKEKTPKNDDLPFCQSFKNKECSGCELETTINCRWERKLLWQFQSVFSPYLLVSTIGMVLFSYWSGIRAYSIAYSCFLVVYFIFIRLKVLCSHCPYYEQKKFLEPLPKIWKYDRKPMNLLEKIINFMGHFFFILFPASIQPYGLWFLVKKTSIPNNAHIITIAIFLGLTILTAIYYVVGLATKLCTKCVNIHCPQNRVSKKSVKLYTSKFSLQSADKN